MQSVSLHSSRTLRRPKNLNKCLKLLQGEKNSTCENPYRINSHKPLHGGIDYFHDENPLHTSTPTLTLGLSQVVLHVWELSLEILIYVSKDHKEEISEEISW